jgi:hypothetical protein
MRIIFISFWALLILASCSSEKDWLIQEDFLSLSHDLGHISYDALKDDVGFNVCDSTDIYSGRNVMLYKGGNSKLVQDCMDEYKFDTSYKDYNGYIIIRFMMNCKGDVGRYRARSINLDFSPQKSPANLLQHALTIVKNRTDWSKSMMFSEEREYSKFINFKFKNGKLEHVVL